ncbi:hypothetical protein E5288_WYG000720 [Bos mutus]|uniref:Uncharacterized protein n=1 Tax=Bos mutus TaxID=72004 RepID=A0A6B0SFL3_9CETA|nr:hypothetical protein [Bos mutus]
MKLLLLCLGLTLVCAQEGNSDVVRSNFDIPKDKAAPVTLPTAREPETSPELKNEFVEICQKYGVVKENIIDLTKVDRCLQARGNGVA